jgi:hypothetical protein
MFVSNPSLLSSRWLMNAPHHPPAAQRPPARVGVEAQAAVDEPQTDAVDGGVLGDQVQRAAAVVAQIERRSVNVRQASPKSPSTTCAAERARRNGVLPTCTTPWKTEPMNVLFGMPKVWCSSIPSASSVKLLQKSVPFGSDAPGMVPATKLGVTLR